MTYAREAAHSNSGSRNTHFVYQFLTEEHVYDLGWRENWGRLLKQPLFDNGTRHHGQVLYTDVLAESSQCVQVAEDEPGDDSTHVEF